jgi:predicted DNA-binding transcriptional regulator YafY
VAGFHAMIRGMRADRLVAILMLLQTRGQVTAAEIAAELEVSERTARRDLDALGMAGVPVYARPGRNGGWQLLGGGRTDLSGLTAAEARALFLVAGPANATPELKAALRKLVRALPEPFRPGAQAASEAIVVDHNSWGTNNNQRPTPPFLDALQQAVIDGEQVELHYVARDRAETTRIVHPLGHAAKGHSW